MLCRQNPRSALLPLEATPRKVGPLSGNGVTTDFSFEFKVFDETDLTVIRTSPNGGDVTLSQPSQYSVVLNPDQDADPGGIVRLTTPLLTDYDLTILSSIPATQPLDWENQGRFSPAAMNDGLDRNTALIQQLLRDISNTLRVPATVGPINVEKPVGGSILAWSTDAQSLISIDPQSLIGFAAYGEGVVDVFAGDGTETTFSLSLNPGAETNLTVSIGGVLQAPGADYNWTSGTALVFTEAPPAGVDIVVRYQRALPSEGGGGGGGGGTGDVVGPISSIDGRIALFDGSTGKAIRQASLAIGDVLSRGNHTGAQLAATISDFSEAVDDRVAALLVAGSGISLSYNDGTGALTISATGGGGGGSGDVVGPSSSIDGRIALFDGTTGKLIRQGSLALGDLALANHSHSNATTGAAGFMSAADKSKLDGVAAGATANATDAALRDRSTHTGTQSVSTIVGLGAAALLAVGTTAGTVAAGNDSRIVGAAQLSGAAFTGDVSFGTKATFARAQTDVEPTLNRAADYGQVSAANTKFCVTQGTVSTPITDEQWARPMVYFERHVAGRMSSEPSGLIDANLDSNWLLAPTFMVQTVIGANGSNANAGIHSRVISDTAIGTTPTATGSLSQAGMEASVNCLCAYVGTVRVNAPTGQKARPAWVMNWECVWQTGNAPDNLCGVELDMINTGGGASGPLPSAGNNFSAFWAQSAPRGTSSGNKKYATTALYVSDAGVAGMGWHAGVVMRTAIGSYGAYFENTSSTDAPTGTFLSGRWSYGLRAVGNFDTSFIKQDSQCGSYLVDVRNAGASAGAAGIKVTINRGNDDTTVCEFLSPNGFAFYATGDNANPIRMRVGGAVRRIGIASLGSLVSGNEVLYAL